MTARTSFIWINFIYFSSLSVIWKHSNNVRCDQRAQWSVIRHNLILAWDDVVDAFSTIRSFMLMDVGGWLICNIFFYFLFTGGVMSPRGRSSYCRPCQLDPREFGKTIPMTVKWFVDVQFPLPYYLISWSLIAACVRRKATVILGTGVRQKKYWIIR